MKYASRDVGAWSVNLCRSACLWCSRDPCTTAQGRDMGEGGGRKIGPEAHLAVPCLSHGTSAYVA